MTAPLNAKLSVVTLPEVKCCTSIWFAVKVTIDPIEKETLASTSALSPDTQLEPSARTGRPAALAAVAVTVPLKVMYSAESALMEKRTSELPGF